MEFVVLMVTLAMMNICLTGHVTDLYEAGEEDSNENTVETPAEAEPQTLFDALFHRNASSGSHQ